MEHLSDFQKSLENHFKTQTAKTPKDIKLVIETLEQVTEKSAISLELICAIWDYFRENLNSNFNDGLHGMELYMGPKSAKDYMNLKPNILTKFVKIFAQHLQKVPRIEKELQRFFSRMKRNQFFNGLKEIGIVNFCTFFIELYKNCGHGQVLTAFLSYVEPGLDSG